MIFCKTENDFSESKLCGHIHLHYVDYSGHHRWIVTDRDEFGAWMNERAGERGEVAFEKTTARELLDQQGANVEELESMTSEDRADYAWVESLGKKHGWDTPLYRSDPMNIDYTDQKIDDLDAYSAAFLRYESAKFVSCLEVEFI